MYYRSFWNCCLFTLHSYAVYLGKGKRRIEMGKLSYWFCT